MCADWWVDRAVHLFSGGGSLAADPAEVVADPEQVVRVRPRRPGRAVHTAVDGDHIRGDRKAGEVAERQCEEWQRCSAMDGRDARRSAVERRDEAGAGGGKRQGGRDAVRGVADRRCGGRQRSQGAHRAMRSARPELSAMAAAPMKSGLAALPPGPQVNLSEPLDFVFCASGEREWDERRERSEMRCGVERR